MIIFDKTPRCLIQGMTGKEGQRALNWMQATGINVVAGVTPGKGGQSVNDIPVFNSIAEAQASVGDIDLTSIYVPPKFVKGAALEAISAKIPTIHIIGEGIPTLDTVQILETANKAGVHIVGPSSIGWALPGIGAIGSMGGGDMSQFLVPEAENGVAVLAKSGGMANTIATMLTQHNIPQSVVLGIGGDRIIGTTFADMLPELATDTRTKAVVIIGEIGGAYEEVLAETITSQHFEKPVIAFISGLFAETLPQGVAFGHAGAIVSKTEGTRDGKIEALKKAGAHIAQSPLEIIDIVQSL